jgi:hypothetical protein
MKRIKMKVAVLALLLLAALAGCSSPPEPPVPLPPLFPDLHGWDLKQVSITGADAVLDFKRVDCVWVVGDDKIPSDESKVTILVEKLVGVLPGGRVAIESGRYEDFQVGDDKFTYKVVLTLKDRSSFAMFIGAPALTKPAYVRLADSKEVYWVDDPLFKNINLDKAFWLSDTES